MIGKIISHYKILEETGRGGMGVVYKAEDTKLKRMVALKFLPIDFPRDPESRERFINEARAAAALNHDNICTVYEIDEYEDQLFISMEYIDGRSLKSIIDEGPMELSRVLDIAIQLVDGLGEAHDKSVIHRDIKPANIMITEKGRVKIMDFGLAKLHNQTTLTKEGTMLGTVSYMSPEQASGKTVDNRTDIWSFGVMLYEMISGRRPFTGEYDQAMIYSVLNDAPAPLTAVRTGVPLELERIVTKCMEKNCEERYQTAKDLMADLRHLNRIITEKTTKMRPAEPPPAHPSIPPEQPSKTTTPVAPGLRKLKWMPWLAAIALVVVLAFVLIPRFFGNSVIRVDESPVPELIMLVVLPFENLGPPEDEYFADGISDAITARLAGLKGLGVISRQSAIQYKGSSQSTHEISNELGVDYILEGTIQRERPFDPGSRVRIIPQLIDCAHDIHLWADTYDEDMTEVFRLQSEIAERVARELDIKLLEPERRALEAEPTDDLEAYEYYLKGIEHVDRRVNEEASRESVRMFEKAVELDPNFAIAWAQLSISYTWLYWRGWGKDELSKARKAVDEAISIVPDLPEAQLALGFFYYYGSRDYEQALRHLQKVHRKQPGNFEANEAIGFIKRRQGRWEEALRIFKETLAVNPRSYMSNWDHLGNTYNAMRRYDEAEKYVDRAISLAPDMPSAYFTKAEIIVLRDGDRELAKHYFQLAVNKTPPERKCILSTYFYYLHVIRILFDSPCDRISYMNLADCTPLNVSEKAYMKIAQAKCSMEKNNRAEAAAFLDSARVILEREIDGEGEFSPVSYSALGLVYAYLGLREKAIDAGERAVELLPISKDAYDGTIHAQILAEIYTITGEYEAAIDQLEILLSVPSLISANSMRIDPVWNPLRNSPRFERLLEKHQGSGL